MSRRHEALVRREPFDECSGHVSRGKHGLRREFAIPLGEEARAACGDHQNCAIVARRRAYRCGSGDAGAEDGRYRSPARQPRCLRLRSGDCAARTGAGGWPRGGPAPGTGTGIGAARLERGTYRVAMDGHRGPRLRDRSRGRVGISSAYGCAVERIADDSNESGRAGDRDRRQGRRRDTADDHASARIGTQFKSATGRSAAISRSTSCRQLDPAASRTARVGATAGSVRGHDRRVVDPNRTDRADRRRWMVWIAGRRR